MIAILLSLMAQPLVVTMSDPECPALEASLVRAMPPKIGGKLSGARGPRGELTVELRSPGDALQGRRELVGSPTCEERARHIVLLVEAWTMDLTPLSPPPAPKPQPKPAKNVKLPPKRPLAAPTAQLPAGPTAPEPRLELPEPKTSDSTHREEVGPRLKSRVAFEPDATPKPAALFVESAESPASERSWGWAIVGGSVIAGGLTWGAADDRQPVAFLPVVLVTTGAIILVSSLIAP